MHAAQRRNWPGPCRRAGRPHAPGRSVGLGRDFGPPRGSLLGQLRPNWRRPLLAVGSDPTAVRPIRPNKTAVSAGSPWTLGSIFETGGSAQRLHRGKEKRILFFFSQIEQDAKVSTEFRSRSKKISRSQQEIGKDQEQHTVVDE